MKKLNFKVATTSSDHLKSIKEAAFSAGCEWSSITITATYILCVDSIMYPVNQEEFEHSTLPLIHTFGQIDQLSRLPVNSNSGRFQEGDPIYLVDLLRSPCVSEGFYDGGYEEADYYNLVYPRNSEGFFSAVEKAKQLLELALIPF